jgi:hypothetical protein
MLLRLVRREDVTGQRKHNVEVILGTLASTGLVIGYRPTPAGIAYANGAEFWKSSQ